MKSNDTARYYSYRLETCTKHLEKSYLLNGAVPGVPASGGEASAGTRPRRGYLGHAQAQLQGRPPSIAHTLTLGGDSEPGATLT
jgi:hypothetical protein